MKTRLLAGDIHLLDLKTRMPFKYGIATMTSTPHLFLRLHVTVGGCPATGIAADHLPPKWFTKDPARPIDAEVADMLRVIEHALQVAVGLDGDSPFEVWEKLLGMQSDWGKQESLPPLLTQFGSSLVERAMIEAVCRHLNLPLSKVLWRNLLGIQLGDVHPSLKGSAPIDLLPRAPRSWVWARHTVGLADPLEDADIPPDERLDDGLPQSLAACIDAYNLRHFKIKVTGDVDRDVERLRRIANVLDRHTRSGYEFSLDGNEAFRDVATLLDYALRLDADRDLKAFWPRLLFVEQPFHRDVALRPDQLFGLKHWRGRPRLIIDESDAEMSSLWHALKLGYDGTSHKNCKGVIKSVVHACKLQALRKSVIGGFDADNENRICLSFDPPNLEASRTLILSGEDLANIGPVALLQDLAVCAALGIESVERNGHHYFAGLSMFPQEVQRQILDAHGDLYHASPAGWPTLTIRHGRINLESINQAPFGVGPVIDVEQFTPLDKWREAHRK